nr:Trp biosynthesis-associated membrane protein [Microbacterium pseudoresistens]
MQRRGRSLSALLFVLGGGIGIISSTQTWLLVARADGGERIEVAGATALPMLAPLSLTALALGAAVALVGVVLRYVFAVVGVGVAVVLIAQTIPIVVDPPLSAVSPALTEATGLAGQQALSRVVDGITPTAWPWLALVGWAVVLLAAVIVLISARRWRRGGRRFESTARPSDGPVDAVESWDELSGGTDPTR